MISPPHAHASKSSRLEGLRIALVFPTFTDIDLASYQENARFLGAIPPLTLAYVATELRAHGAEVLLVDSLSEGLTLEAAIARVQDFDPHYVGFTLTTVDWSSSLFWIQGFKAAMDARILVGGVNMSCYPAETLSHPEIDLGWIGYADLGLVDLLETDRRGARPEGLPGAVYRDAEGQVVVNPPASHDGRAASMGWPARDLLPIHNHFSIVSTRAPFTAAMSNFGCPFGCEFCILANQRVRWRSATDVVDEMDYCVRTLGIREMDFFDPIFTLKKERTHAICQEIRRRGLHKEVLWSVRARTDTVDHDVLDALWGAGCRRIFYGVESGSDRILARVDKTMKSSADIRRVIRLTKAKGFEVLVFVMVGNPLETRETVNETRQLLMESPVDFVQIASLFPLPNTPIYQAIVAETGRDFWREHILHGTPVQPFPLLDTELTSEEVDRLVTRLYLSFYFRPRFARTAWGRAKEPLLLKRGLAAAWGLSSHYLKDRLDSLRR